MLVFSYKCLGGFPRLGYPCEIITAGGDIIVQISVPTRKSVRYRADIRSKSAVMRGETVAWTARSGLLLLITVLSSVTHYLTYGTF